IASGDRVAVRRTVTATHEGEFAGIPATGREVSRTGMTIYRIADSRIAEAWWSYDALGLMMQLTGGGSVD
ncbi:MAG: ester cyclase, partial [Gemmatimonadota bacterium]